MCEEKEMKEDEFDESRLLRGQKEFGKPDSMSENEFEKRSKCLISDLEKQGDLKKHVKKESVIALIELYVDCMHYAAYYGKIDFIGKVIDKISDICNTTDTVDIIKEIFTKRIINFGRFSINIMHCAAANNRYKFITKILKEVWSVDKTVKAAKKPAEDAGEDKKGKNLVLEILKAGDNKGRTPLHYAVMFASLDSIKAILQEGKSAGIEQVNLLSIPDKSSMPVIHYAASVRMFENPDLRAYLPEMDENRLVKIIDLVVKELGRRDLTERTFRETADGFGNTLLHRAASEGLSDVVKSLLRSLRDKEMQMSVLKLINLSSFTASHCAAFAGHHEVLKAISDTVGNEAFLELMVIEDKHHCIPLFYAMSNCEVGTVEFICGKIKDCELLKEFIFIDGISGQELPVIGVSRAVARVIRERIDSLSKPKNGILGTIFSKISAIPSFFSECFKSICTCGNAPDLGESTSIQFSQDEEESKQELLNPFNTAASEPRVAGARDTEYGRIVDPVAKSLSRGIYTHRRP